MKKAKVSDKFTVCTKCKFVFIPRNALGGKYRWYNRFCQASPLPKARDPFDGQVKPYTDGVGSVKCFVDYEFSYCKDINKDGNCPGYRPKLRS